MKAKTSKLPFEVVYLPEDLLVRGIAVAIRRARTKGLIRAQLRKPNLPTVAQWRQLCAVAVKGHNVLPRDVVGHVERIYAQHHVMCARLHEVIKKYDLGGAGETVHEIAARELDRLCAAEKARAS